MFNEGLLKEYQEGECGKLHRKIEGHPGPPTLHTGDRQKLEGNSLHCRTESGPSLCRTSPGWGMVGPWQVQAGRGPHSCMRAEVPSLFLPLHTLHPATQLMKCLQRIMRAEEASGCQVPHRPWVSIRRVALLLLLLGMVIGCLVCSVRLTRKQQVDSAGWDLAELQLNHTGSRQDPRLRWQGSPALGRSFVHGPELDNGQLRIQRDGIYRLHIQVTLANCSSSTWTAKPLSATLSVAICFPTAHSISLLRLNFHQSCSVASQRLTFLAHGDILCTNLTPPLLPSRNADETFFGIQWVCP
ncbi:CD70 antigen [Lagenorhynchus albirostris]|uniref:CD70 antigen n=1 Tax=Lagenorhynchus albirostris TaxID=27610 RepID=UPI0028E7F619|nr:CD70 antigen [Lagenorhynchus albirostris]